MKKLNSTQTNLLNLDTKAGKYITKVLGIIDKFQTINISGIISTYMIRVYPLSLRGKYAMLKIYSNRQDV